MVESKVKIDRILINSLPKSGTHLLAKAIEIFGYEEHFGLMRLNRENIFLGIFRKHHY